MAGTRREFTRGYRRIMAVLLMLGLLATMVSFAHSRPTAASWTSHDAGTGSFSALDIGKVASAQCEDSRILGLGLLNNEVRLSWDSPAGLESAPDGSVEYVVTWRESGLLHSPSGTLITTSPEYTHQARGFGLLGLTMSFTVQPRVKTNATEWLGEPISAGATKVSLLGLGLIMQCGAIT